LIFGIEQRILRYGSSERTPRCRKLERRRCWENNYSDLELRANYREACRARSKAEFIAKCGDCLREVDETAYWLELLVESRIVSAARLALLRQESDELTAIFVTILKRAKQ
jgi:hypothetical protein